MSAFAGFEEPGLDLFYLLVTGTGRCCVCGRLRCVGDCPWDVRPAALLVEGGGDAS